MAIKNVDELIIEKIRGYSFSDPATTEILIRATQIEDGQLECTADSQKVTDAVGAPITTLYKAKEGKFSGSNSILNLGLLAAQYGTRKEVGSDTSKITTVAQETFKVETGTTSYQLKHTPKSADKIKYIYKLVNRGIADKYTAGAAALATEFVVSETGAVTMPTGAEGTFYVEYEYETENAIKIDNMTENFPQTGVLVVDVLFNDPCNDNIKYVGKIISKRAKLNAESSTIDLKPDGKHPFEFNLAKDYCDELDDRLYSVIVADD